MQSFLMFVGKTRFNFLFQKTGQLICQKQASLAGPLLRAFTVSYHIMFQNFLWP